jgi:hypothetical protein
MNGINWLSRHISAPGPFLCLCLSEQEYLAALQHLDKKPTADWVSTPQADATAHTIMDGDTFAVIVCLRGYKTRPAIEIAGVLVHEAVHAWQKWCAYYGEESPADEQEAYAIQSIAQELMGEFARRLQGK